MKNPEIKLIKEILSTIIRHCQERSLLLLLVPCVLFLTELLIWIWSVTLGSSYGFLITLVVLFLSFPTITCIQEADAEDRFPNKSAVKLTGAVLPLPLAHGVKENGSAKQVHSRSKKLPLKFDLSASSNHFATETMMMPLDYDNYIFTLSIKIGSGYGINTFPLYFDTGSSLIWVQCDSGTNAHAGNVFHPSDSETYSLVNPSDPFCVSPYKPDVNNQKCTYSIQYGDNSQTRTDGVLAREEFTLISVTLRDPDFLFSSTSLVFGCSDNSQTKLKDFKNGILGMGGGQTSLPMQLFPDFDGFWYCISDNGKSSLTFGVDDELEIPGGQSTPILTQVSGTKHFLELHDIGINGRPLDIPAEYFQVSQNGKGAFFIDSGCTYGRLVTEAHERVKGELSHLFASWSDPPTEQAPFDICYKGRVGTTIPDFSKLPSMTYYLSGGAEFTIPAEKLFKRVNNDTYLCVTTTTNAENTIVGVYQHLNTRLSYNLAEKRLTFIQEECSRSP